MTKLVAGRLSAKAPAGPHPAPELLSAFAENALSDAERGPLVQHLATCSDCREILYLALPDSEQMQKVLVPQPRPFGFRLWIFGWGALVASVAVAAVFFGTYRLEHRNQSASMSATAPNLTATNGSAAAKGPAVANDNETKVAGDKAPQQLEQMRDAMQRDSNKAKIAVAEAKSESTPRPEAMHMTAKPQASLDFDESGQVRVSAPGNPTTASSDQVSEIGSEMKSAGSRAQNLPLEGRNLGLPASVTAANASPSVVPQTLGDAIAGKNAIGPAYSRPDLLAGKSATKGNLVGMVLDPAGAAVANARVAVLGASGEKVVTSGQDGMFSFDTLSPGSYSVNANATGFKATEIKQVAVLADMPATLQVRLEPGAASEVVEVSSAAPVVTELSATAAEATGASAGFVAPPQAASAQLSKAAAAKSRRKDSMVGLGVPSPPLQWTLSPEGSVQRSGDSGKTWQLVSVAAGISFRALSAVGANIWVGGKAGVLYHSSDFGQTWVQIQAATGNTKLDHDIVRVDFPDALNGTVSTANGAVWTTSDGAKSWQIK